MNHTILTRVFILGAGFSRAIIGNDCPLKENLYDKVADELPEEIKCKLCKFGVKDIELALTYIDLEILYKPNNKSLVQNRRNVEDRIYKIFEKMMPKSESDYTPAAKKFVDLLKKNDTIITFNYDTYLETLLWLKKKWSPAGGYTKYVGNLLLDETENEKKYMNIEILKLHGSLNFKKGDYLDNPKKFYIGLEVNEKFFPKSYQHFGIIKGEEPYIVLPTYLKISWPKEILFLWHTAYERISEASDILIIGYSFSEADSFSHMLLSHIRYDKNPKKRKIFIIDPEAEKIKEKMEKNILIAPEYIEEYIDWNILSGRLEDQIDKLKSKVYNTSSS